ncbi:MAG TPA: Mrp/NBP35 family ATP-binding protein [Saprospiraceae bacterium]|nr:Mrp/NBP35 family ATP-binding protein [Saprospiraceae bacterium]
MIEIADVKKALANLRDPETGQDLIASGRIKDINIRGQYVQCTMVLPSLQATYKESLYQAVQGEIEKQFPDYQVHIHMEVAAAGSTASSPLPHVKNIVAVASGKGGVGKSTISVNLALALHKAGWKVGILDADLYGPSIPTMLDLTHAKPKVEVIQGAHKLIPLEAYGVPVISMGFIVEPEQAVVLRGPRLGGIIKQFITDCLWPPLDILVVDLPPGTGDIQLTLVQSIPVTGAIMVTTPQQVAVADAIKASSMFMLDNVAVPIIGVVENMSWFTPVEMPDKKYYLFGKGGGERLAHYTQSTLLGKVPLIQAVQELSDRGKPAALQSDPLLYEPFKHLAEQTIKQLQVRNDTLKPTEVVRITTS